MGHEIAISLPYSLKTELLQLKMERHGIELVDGLPNADPDSDEESEDRGLRFAVPNTVRLHVSVASCRCVVRAQGIQAFRFIPHAYTSEIP
jgi:hypothetical protein